MGYYEENILYKDRFFSTLAKKKKLQKLRSRRPEPVLQPMSMYETLPGHDIIEDNDLFDALGDFDGVEFQTYLNSMRLFGEKIRNELES